MKKIFTMLWQALKAVGRFLDRYLVLPVMAVLGRWMVGRVNAAKAERQAAMEPWKSEAVEDFRVWVEDLPAEKPGLEGPFGDGSEVMVLLKEFAALRQEIVSQNREQHKTTVQLQDIAQTFEDVSRIFEQKTQGLEQLATSIRRAVEKETVLPFLSLRDVLLRGQAAAQAAAAERSFLRRPPAALSEAVEGYAAAILRLDRALDKVGIHKVPTIGHIFDAKTMIAISRRLEPDRARNMVLEEERSGYVRGSEVIRTAEVVVNG